MFVNQRGERTFSLKESLIIFLLLDLNAFCEDKCLFTNKTLFPTSLPTIKWKSLRCSQLVALGTPFMLRTAPGSNCAALPPNHVELLSHEWLWHSWDDNKIATWVHNNSWLLGSL